MSIDQIVVALLCVAAAFLVARSEVKRVKRKYSGEPFIPLSKYDDYKIFYCAGFICIAFAYGFYTAKIDAPWSWLYLSALCFVGGKYGRRLDKYLDF